MFHCTKEDEDWSRQIPLKKSRPCKNNKNWMYTRPIHKLILSTPLLTVVLT